MQRDRERGNRKNFFYLFFFFKWRRGAQVSVLLFQIGPVEWWCSSTDTQSPFKSSSLSPHRVSRSGHPHLYHLSFPSTSAAQSPQTQSRHPERSYCGGTERSVTWRTDLVIHTSTETAHSLCLELYQVGVYRSIRLWHSCADEAIKILLLGHVLKEGKDKMQPKVLFRSDILWLDWTPDGEISVCVWLR